MKLDIHEHWISEEVRQYTPYPRTDELQKAGAERLLRTWGKAALKAYLAGLKTVLVQDVYLKWTNT